MLLTTGPRLPCTASLRAHTGIRLFRPGARVLSTLAPNIAESSSYAKRPEDAADLEKWQESETRNLADLERQDP